MKIAVFEDESIETFEPLTLTRPVFSLKMGMESLCTRYSRVLDLPLGSAFTREYLAESTEASMGVPVNPTVSDLQGDWLFLNGRISDPTEIRLEGPDEVGISRGSVVYARVCSETIRESGCSDMSSFLDFLKKKCKQEETEVPMLGSIWELMLESPDMISRDFNDFDRTGIHGKISEGSYVVGEESDIYVAPTAVVDPLVVLDASEGPIYIDEDVRVFPHTRVEGPSYIGRGTQLVGGKIREGCSIGPVCRVGGEVEESIFHGHSNKYHDGFIGHSYVGEWVNLGALTTNSDLKNDYTDVKIYVNGSPTDTGSTKVGSFIGDHVKTGIGSLLNTGTMIGVMSILMPSGEVFPKDIPSFCILHRNKVRRGLGLEKLVETASKVMGRRGVEMREADVRVLQHVYRTTAERRETLIKRDRRKRAR